MQRRGRSRQVSHAALARQASEERHFKHSEPGQRQSQCSSLSYNPPPSPKQLHPQPQPPHSPTHANRRIPSHTQDDVATVVDTASHNTSMRSLSLSPASCDLDNASSHESQSCSTSLEDDIHIAYALDDIHLAKVLLLRLKGIEVTSDDDPRIAAVQDEDFDFCFVPCGKLMLDEADEKALQEAQRKEREKWEEKQRKDRLRECERIWEKEKSRLREEKQRAQRKKEQELVAEEAKRVAKEQEAAERARNCRRLKFGSATRTRGVVSYGSLPQTRQLPTDLSISEDKDPFRYEVMMPPSARGSVARLDKALGRRMMDSAKIRKDLSLPLSSSLPTNTGGCSTVPFKDVVASMHGPLFPIDASEETPKGRSFASSQLSPSAKRTPAQSDLLSSLLKVVEWEDGERRRAKGKATVGRPTPSRSWSWRGSPAGPSNRGCAACSAESSSAASTAASSSTTVSRSSSWLTFGSRRSGSTAVTSPSTSPISSWLKSSPLPTSSITAPSFSTSPLRETDPYPAGLRHSCAPRLALVAPDDCPLRLVPPGASSREEEKSSLCREAIEQQAPPRVKNAASGQHLVRRMRRSISSFVEIARGFQTACISATILSIAAPFETDWPRTHPTILATASPSKIRSTNITTKPELLPPGYRARSADVSIFVCPSEEEQAHSAPILFIPLTSTHDTEPRRTPLPSPFPLVFPPAPPVCRSPFRPQTPPPAGAIVWRMRPVANPVVLRLRALHNVLWERGCGWEGRARDGGLGCGKERVVGVAFEGLGRSRLSQGEVHIA